LGVVREEARGTVLIKREKQPNILEWKGKSGLIQSSKHGKEC